MDISLEADLPYLFGRVWVYKGFPNRMLQVYAYLNPVLIEHDYLTVQHQCSIMISCYERHPRDFVSLIVLPFSGS